MSEGSKLLVLAMKWVGPQRRPVVGRLLIGLLCAVVALLVRLALHPLVGNAIPWVTFFVAVLLSALLGGALSALVTIVACLASGSWLLLISGELAGGADRGDMISIGSFVINAAIIGGVGSALRWTVLALRTVRDSALAAKAELTTQVEDLTRLHRFGTEVVGQADRDLLFRTLLEATVALQGASRGFIALVDSSGAYLVGTVSVGHPSGLFDLLGRAPIGEGHGACGTAAARRQRVVIEDTEIDPLFTGLKPIARAAGFRAVWSTPLYTRDGVLLGVLSTQFERPHRPTEREVKLVEIYARLAADATEAADLLARAERARGAAEAALGELKLRDRRKDEFLAMLGHELRNPLAPIRSVIDLVKRRGELRPRELEILDRQTATLTRIVDDLLDVARITHGKIELRREPLEVQAAVRRAVDSVRAAVDQRGHHLEVHLPGSPLFVDADPVRLEQVVVNLIGNAAKYTPPGGHLGVRAELRAERVRVSVQDDGVGIAASRLGSVFDLFEQGEQALDRSAGGLGIGLTVVRRLVELHGGSVRVDSPGEGKGSTFSFELPVSARQAQGVAPKAPAAASGRRQRALVVDDNPDAATGLAELVESFGYEVEVAGDGPTALDAAGRFNPDVVLLDIGLPGMDGYAVARTLCQRGFATKLVAVTGYGQDSDRERARGAGFSHHLVKPVPMEALVEVLEAPAQSP
jgi:signal transduction histidine kinase